MKNGIFIIYSIIVLNVYNFEKLIIIIFKWMFDYKVNM